jgi:CubicO group peptidase (beta-lactamase class C family)
VHGYSVGKDVTRSSEVAWAWAAGGVVSTATDISRFFQGLLGGELAKHVGQEGSGACT